MTHIDFFVLAGLLQWLKPVHHHKLDSLYAIGEQGDLHEPRGRLVVQVQQLQGLLQWLTTVIHHKISHPLPPKLISAMRAIA